MVAEKLVFSEEEEREHSTSLGNLTYDEVEVQPEFHFQTYIAIAAIFFLNLAQIQAIIGPSSALTYIVKSLGNTNSQIWVPNALLLPQAILAPILSSISDTFQARKFILVGTSLLSLVGTAIAPGSHSIYRLIVAQMLIGASLTAAPIAYAVPSEILPRKWRPMAQAIINVGVGLGALLAPLVLGALTQAQPNDGWRKFYWIQLGFCGAATIGVIFGYRPPKRHTELDNLAFLQKIVHLDITGSVLLLIGLTLFLVGLTMGSGQFPWSDVRVLATLIIGIVFLVAFIGYEWKGTKTGIIHHDLFRGNTQSRRNFSIGIGLIIAEGGIGFAFNVYYPILTTTLFEQRPFFGLARLTPYWIAVIISAVLWGYFSIRFSSVRWPLFFGYLFLTVGSIAFATVQPGDDLNALVFAALQGIGFGGALVLIIATVQLSSPPRFIATATAVIASARAIGSNVFTAIFYAVLNDRLKVNIPKGVGSAALGAGLPETSLPIFIQALTSHDTAMLANIPGISPSIIALGVVALQQAYADSIRVIFIISAAIGALACISCLFLGSLKETMNYQVDAPIEKLYARHQESDQHRP